MTTLPKYSRQYHDDFINYLTSACRLRKKDVLNKIKNKSTTDVMRYLLYSVNASKNLAVARFLSISETELGALACFDSGMHFCVSNLPEKVDYNAYADGLPAEDLYIDFRYNGIDCFIHTWKRNWGIAFGGTPYVYQLSLYMNNPDMHHYNKEAIGNDYGRFYDFIQVYKLHLTADGKSWFFEIADANRMLKDSVDIYEEVASTGETAFTSSDVMTLCDSMKIPAPDELVNIVNHVVRCFKYRQSITRKNSKAGRSYNSCKVHVARTEKSTEDTYVPLVTYAYEERQKSEYKGGHHASPKEHDRRGYFRKSRGRGDYDLVNGEIIYVGDMKGKYSKVTPTHVAGKKPENITIYKA